MEDLLHQRCFNHLLREAVARCPLCQRYFCRECVTEHEDKVLCAACLRADADTDRSDQGQLGGLVQMMHFLLGATLLWVFFYYLGQILLSLPSAFHEGTLWEKGWWN
ncbi:MAG: rhomboid family protein [Deltaproteobacteria bacterium]|nr:rhomboid family protein [Deltaproteobacteria bacterium]